MPTRARTHRDPWLALGAILAMTAAALSLAAARAQQSTDQPRAGTAQMVSAEDLSDDPQKYYGQMVTIREDVEDVLGANLFTLDDGGFSGSARTSSSSRLMRKRRQRKMALSRSRELSGSTRRLT